MLRHVAGQRVSQTSLRQQDRAAEANETCGLSAQFRHAVIGRLCPFDCGNTSIEEALSGFRERQSPRRALKETDT